MTSDFNPLQLRFLAIPAFTLGIALFSTPLRAASPVPVPAATAAVPTAPPASPTVTPSPWPPLSPAARAGLLREFQKAQKTALAALLHLQKMEMAALESSQTASFKEWWAKQGEERRKFFAGPHKGVEKRAYMKELKARREVFINIQADELSRRKGEQKTRVENEREAQARNLREFKELLEQGKTPPMRLWPEGQAN